MTELEPCPFCGKRDLDRFYNGVIHFYIRCNACHLTMSNYDEDKLIERWNRRVNE